MYTILKWIFLYFIQNCPSYKLWGGFTYQTVGPNVKSFLNDSNAIFKQIYIFEPQDQLMKSPDLVITLNKRDSKALDLIYRDYYRMLVLYALNYLKEQMQAEDCVQESIITAWQSDLTFKTEAVFRSYLYTAVRNKALNILRHQKVKDGYADEFELEHEKDEEELIITQEYYQILFSAVERLKPDQREVIEMNLLQGGKLIEIAEALKISYRTAKRRKEMGIKELRKTLEDALYLIFIIS